MTTSAFFCALFVFALPLAAAESPVPAEPAPLRTMLREALFAEEGERDLEKAAAGYAGMLTQFEAQRKLAATALFRLAEVREKQGKKTEAMALHQRLLAEFPKEEALVKISRDRLAALGAPATAVAATAAGEPDALSAKEAEELAKVREMVKNSPDLLDAPKADGESPLLRAATNGWVQVATFLLDHGALINGKPGTWVPLQWAARDGRKKIVELLLTRGADVNAATPEGWTAIHAASANDRVEVARVLLEHGAKPDIALKSGLLTFEAAGATPLLTAVLKKEAAMARLLVEKGADVNWADPWMGESPLWHAAATGQDEVVKLLLEHKAKVDQPNKTGLTPLMTATFNQHRPVVVCLCQAGADLNAADEQGFTALHFAAERSAELVEQLLAAGASPKAVTKAGLTPLHASLSKLPDGMATLQVRGSPVSPQVPPEYAASLDKVWSMLVAKGVDLKAQDKQGFTLLQYVCSSSNVSLPRIDALLKMGADATQKTPDGATIYDLVPDRVELEAHLIFPKFAKERAVTAFVRNLPFSGPHRIEPATDDSPPPTLQAVLEKAQPNSTTSIPLGRQLKAAIYRLDAAGECKLSETVKLGKEGADSAVPTLRWGDVVVVTHEQNVPGIPLPDSRRRARVLNSVP